MTRNDYIENFKKTYQLMHVWVNKDEYTVFHFRHRRLNKDIVLRSYAEKVSAYEELVNIDCKNLPKIYDTIILDDGMIVLEEYIDSITLAESMEIKKYNYKEASKILKSLCKAIEVLHGMNIIHRDIKPENVLISKNNHVVLIDFNAYRKLNDSKKDTVVMGTVGYASPEQLGITQSDQRTDIYAMGVLLNVMLTGRHPSESMAKGRGGKIIRKCTDISPQKRYQSAKKLYRAL